VGIKRRLRDSIRRTAGILALLALLCSASLAESGPSGPPLDRGEILLRLDSSLSIEQGRLLLVSHGLASLQYVDSLDVWRARPEGAVAAASTDAIASQLGDLALWVEPNHIAYAQGTVPDDPEYATRQWGLGRIGMESAWTQSRGQSQVIAVVDSGADLLHPDLADKLWRNGCEVAGNGFDDDGNGYVDDVLGWDFVEHDATPADTYGHGTHVSGIAAADTGNNIGIAGVGWHARIMPLRALGSDGRGTYAGIAEAIRYAADNGARIINLSLGGTSSSLLLAEAVSYAQSKGCLLVAAAGNYGTPALLYPAALDGVLAVGASNQMDLPWESNCWGAEMDIAAPGVAIYSTLPSGLYGLMTGTSMATPHVSGVAALIMAYEPDISWEQASSLITAEAADIGAVGWDPYSGWGRLDAAAALRSIERPPRAHRVLLPMISDANAEGCGTGQ